MNPILHYPVRNPPHRRPNGLIMPGRLSQAGFYEPGSVQQAAAVWDEFGGPAGTDLVNWRTTSGHSWRKHPTWGGTPMVFSDAGRARCAGGSLGIYAAAVEPMSDCIISFRLWWSPGWVGAYQIGIAARINMDADTFYSCYYQANSSGGAFNIAKRVAGAFSTVAGGFGGLSDTLTPRWANNKGGYADVSIVFVGDLIKLFVDGIERGSGRDSSIPCGLPGLYCFTNSSDSTGIHIENFSAKPLRSSQVSTRGNSATVNAQTMHFGGIRAVRTNGATIVASPLLNLTGVGNAGPVAYQWFRSTVAGELPNSRTMLRGQTSATLDDRQAIPGTTYYYRCAITDNAGNTSFTDVHRITTATPTDKFVAFIGNSLTWGNGSGVTKESNDYPTVCLAGLGSPWIGQNYGFPSWNDDGLGLSGMPVFAPYQFDPNFARCVAVYWEGTNSMLSTGAATAAARTLANCAYLKSLGYQVVVCNVIDRQQSGVPADMATRISDYNTALLSGYSTVADAHVDLHALLPDSTNTTNFQTDKVHLTAAGYAIVAGAVQTAVAAL